LAGFSFVDGTASIHDYKSVNCTEEKVLFKVFQQKALKILLKYLKEGEGRISYKYINI
jgi:hypothetical protein